MAAANCEPERRQQRAVAPDAGGDRPQLRAVSGGPIGPAADDDPDRLPAAAPERHQHRLAGLERTQGGRHAVGVRAWPGARGRVDRDLDAGVAVVPVGRQFEHRGHRRLPPR